MHASFTKRPGAFRAHSQRNGKVLVRSSPSKKEWSEYHGRWEKVWVGESEGSEFKNQVLPKNSLFDQGKPPMILTKLLTDAVVTAKGKRAFTPGCGRGYDVLEFARFGASESVGLELAPTALVEAKKYLEECSCDETKAQHAQELTAAQKAVCRFEAGDFFEHGGKYELAFDYTFFCALKPEMREAWARTYARVIEKGGEVICLMWPVVPEKDPNDGPPYRALPEDYVRALEPQGFKITLLEKVPPELSHKPRAGREMIGIFKKL